MQKLSRDVAVSFPSSVFPEVQGLLAEFTECYQPIEGLDLRDAFPSGSLHRKIFDDCFKYPDKSFYWRYEQEGRDPKSKTGQEIAAMNRALLEYLSRKWGADAAGGSIMGWKAHRAKLRHVGLWNRFRTELHEELQEKGLRVTGSFYYPPGGYREWHTNANNPSCWTMYYVRVLEEQKSWFHYVNPTTNQLVQVPDRDGYFHLFSLADYDEVKAGIRPEFFWHNVVSETHRRSLGLRISEEVLREIMGRL